MEIKQFTQPFTAEGKSAADAYICHMYVLRRGRNPRHIHGSLAQ